MRGRRVIDRKDGHARIQEETLMRVHTTILHRGLANDEWRAYCRVPSEIFST